MVLLPTNSAGLTCSENCNTFGRYRPLRVTGRIAKCLILWNGSLQAAIQKGLNTAHNPSRITTCIVRLPHAAKTWPRPARGGRERPHEVLGGCKPRVGRSKPS